MLWGVATCLITVFDAERDCYMSKNWLRLRGVATFVRTVVEVKRDRHMS